MITKTLVPQEVAPIWLAVAHEARTRIDITGDIHSDRNQLLIDNVLVIPVRLQIEVERIENRVVLRWPSGTLQEAESVTGPFRNVLGATSPWTNSQPVAKEKFFRVAW